MSVWDYFDNPHVARRLAGEPHRHHPECIHNLTPDEQIAVRGRTRAWWEAMGLPIPEQITPDDWQSSPSMPTHPLGADGDSDQPSPRAAPP